MQGEIIIYKSSTSYYVAIFAVSIIWVFIGSEQANITLSSIFFNPFDWLIMSATIVVSTILPVSLISYNWKQQVIFTEPNWEFRIREVDISEFDKIMKEYKRAYSSLMNYIDYPVLTLLVISTTTSILFPFAFPFSIPLLIWGPYLFAGLILVSIFLLTMFVFKASPNTATSYFRIYTDKKLRKLVSILWDTRGISWVGISLNIGEAEGYYIIKEVKVVGRIEGIESIGSIEILSNEAGKYCALSKLYLGPSEGTKTIFLNSEYIALESLDLYPLVNRMIITYAKLKGVNEMLEDVMIDLGISLSDQETDVLMSENDDYSNESRVADGQ